MDKRENLIDLLFTNALKSKTVACYSRAWLTKHMWKCTKCGEAIEDQFDSCWRCAGGKHLSNVTPETPKRRGRLTFFGLGVIFEILLILFAAGLPKDSWIQVKAFNFLMLSHYPILAFLERGGLDSAVLGILLILLLGLFMAGLWGLLLRLGVEAAELGVRRIPQKRRRTIAYSAGALLLVLSALLVFDALDNKPRPFKAPPEVKKLVQGNTEFALDLYQKLRAEPGNLFFSPYSISAALALSCVGARGQTDTEIRQTAHFAVAGDTLHNAFGDLASRMKKVRRTWRIQLVSANSVWCADLADFGRVCLEVIRGRYMAKAGLLNTRDPQSASKKINRWIAKETNGKIDGAVDARDLTPDTKLVLCNAVYFKGRWACQFKRRNTRDGSFTVSKDKTVTVPMMYQKTRLRSATLDDLGVHVLELPYYGGDLSMVILLPEAADGLTELEQQLSSTNVAACLARLDQTEPREIAVRLPRFTTTRSFDLKPTLMALGIRSAFGDRSDFSGFDGRKDLYLSQVTHEAYVEVNEAGTEAAAMTLMLVKTKSLTDRFDVDHPFLFLIRENGSGTILFLARILDPIT